ncbi:hypothetical protein [Cyclobacterium sp. SYSU L10401]|nr:hypothetical protein [Cyclobacterium sp. SYSU L10401]
MKFRIIDLERKDREKLLVCDFFGELGGTENGGTATPPVGMNQIHK